MDIAQAKRRENIAEYILYLWQLEDLLRALQFSPEAIFSTLIAPRKDIAEEQKHVYLLWYMDIANLLHQEGKDEKGHLEHTLHLIGDLHDLHLQLMKLSVGEHYRQTYAKLEPELPQHLRPRDGDSQVKSSSSLPHYQAYISPDVEITHVPHQPYLQPYNEYLCPARLLFCR